MTGTLSRSSLQKLLAVIRDVDATCLIVEECLRLIPAIDNPHTDEEFEDMHTFARRATLVFSKTPTQDLSEEAKAAIEADDILSALAASGDVSADILDSLLSKTSHLLQEKVLNALSTVRDSAARATTSVKQARAAESKAVAAADALSEENQRLVQMNTTLVETNKRLQSNVAALELRLDDIRNESQEGHTKVDNVLLKQQNDALEMELERLRESHRRSAAVEADLEKEIETLAAAANSAMTQVESIQKKRAKQEAVVNKLLCERKALKHVVARYLAPRKGIRCLGSYPSGRPKRKVSQNKRYGPTSLSLPTGVVESRRRASAFGASIAADVASAVPSDRREGEQQLRNKLRSLEAENTELRLSINRLSEDISDLTSTHSHVLKLTADIKAKAALVAKLRTTISDLEQQAATKQLTVEALHEQLNAMKAELDASAITIRELKQQLLQAQGKLAATNALSLRRKSSATTTQSEQDSTAAETTTTARRHLPPKQGRQPSPRYLATRDLVALQRNYELELEQRRITYQRELQQKDVQFQAQLEQSRADHLRQLAESQLKTGDIIRRLEDQIADLARRHAEDEVLSPGQHPTKTSDAHVLHDGVLAMNLPGAAASVRIPATALKGRDAIVLHVSFPPQELVALKDGESFELKCMAQGKKAHVTMIDLGVYKEPMASAGMLECS